MNANDPNYQRVLKIVQELVLDDVAKEDITPTIIDEKIDEVVGMRPQWGKDLDRQAICDELIRRFSIWIGQDTTLKNNEDHVDWLNAQRKRDWRYWQRYREWLEARLSPSSVDGLDRSTDRILGLLEDPVREGPWSRRGLVVGHVQSGKTSNYTALICKAADAGYKIIIVLAGLHNNLRAQTQMRLDEGFLGYETKPVFDDDIKVIGVGLVDADPSIRPNFATNRSDNGDFSTAAARNLGITPEQRPWLFVVKKNKTILERLLQWIRNHVANATEDGRRIVTHLPVLVIDDEADHASIDTGEQAFNADGSPDEEHEPKAINSRIRKILHSFARSAYVGYTATPFANIFIHERGRTTDEGPDLFPSAFIINLAAPSNYIGPSRIFGKASAEGRQGGVPLVRVVQDHCTPDGQRGWMPPRHRNGHVPLGEGENGLPPSLVEAIDSFVLACAVRRLRGQGAEHASMLIHVTRFNSVQELVCNAVDAHVSRMRQRIDRGIGHEAVLSRLRTMWEGDFAATSAAVSAVPGIGQACDLSAWPEVVAVLADVLHDIKVRTINGTAKDALDYVENASTGLKVIAIGGDKLARGLTLEGLCTSYFLRSSRMYDTLMQMGRWFGYRPGYLDACRLYTTAELVEWFEHITDAADELRDEFEMMAGSGATPRDYGLKVQSHPVLMVTSRVKMRTARDLSLSFSGRILETVALPSEVDTLQENIQALRSLVADLGTPEVPELRRGDSISRWAGHLWRNATSGQVIDFLHRYRTRPDALKVHAPLLAEFIELMNTAGELVEWSVAIIGSSSQDPDFEVAAGVCVSKISRKREPSVEGYSIGRLLSPRDESIDIDEPTWNAALALTRHAWKADPARSSRTEEPDEPSGIAIRRVKGLGAEGVPARPQRGLLLLYVIDPQYESAGLPSGTPPIVAFGISFPASSAENMRRYTVQYKVNNVLWELEYGSTV